MNFWIPLLLILFGAYGCASTSGKGPKTAQDTDLTTTETAPVEKPAPIKAERPVDISAEQILRLGIMAYENGQYKKSQLLLKNALSSGLKKNADRVTANKYLAFMACADQRREVCKGYFRKAVSVDGKLELSKAEAGHPMWGKAFQEVKAEGRSQGAAK